MSANLFDRTTVRGAEETDRERRWSEEGSQRPGEFLANMSHEMRTPLNAIIGFAEIIRLGKAGPLTATQEEYLDDILASSRHLLQIINDVLDLAKVEAGKIPFEPEPVDLARLVGEVRDVLGALAAEKRIQVDVAVDPAVREIQIDPARLKQVLYNYLSNALKFTAPGGRVAIRAQPSEPSAFRLEVEDSGVGIRPEDLSRLFVEFQQVNGKSTSCPGTGLGLALTRRIVEAQGGQIGVESTFGQGSTFFAIFPRSPDGRVGG